MTSRWYLDDVTAVPDDVTVVPDDVTAVPDDVMSAYSALASDTGDCLIL